MGIFLFETRKGARIFHPVREVKNSARKEWTESTEDAPGLGVTKGAVRA